MARPAGDFSAERYFSADHGVRIYNIGTKPMRAFARSIHVANRENWSIDDAMALADELIRNPYLETKSVGIEIVACYRRDFAPKLLTRWKGWLLRNHSANWATTDAICGALVGRLLVKRPELAQQMCAWSKDRTCGCAARRCPHGLRSSSNRTNWSSAPGGSGTVSAADSGWSCRDAREGRADGRAALAGTTDDYLLTTNWKLLVQGKVVMDQPRHVVLVDTFNHLAHHRGQLTVYLRLNDRPVPAIYGPSADDKQFA